MNAKDSWYYLKIAFILLPNIVIIKKLSAYLYVLTLNLRLNIYKAVKSGPVWNIFYRHLSDNTNDESWQRQTKCDESVSNSLLRKYISENDFCISFIFKLKTELP